MASIYSMHTGYTRGYIVQMFVLGLAQLDALGGRRKLGPKDAVSHSDESA
jgi:hypothetical protein